MQRGALTSTMMLASTQLERPSCEGAQHEIKDFHRAILSSRPIGTKTGAEDISAWVPPFFYSASAIIARTNYGPAFALTKRLPDGRVTRRCPQAGRTIRTTQISKTAPMKSRPTCG
jgi:hypothetical protein